MPNVPTGHGEKAPDQVRWAQQRHLARDTIDPYRQQYLSFRLNDEWYGLNVHQLVEVLPLPKVTRVPRTPEYILGVINLRGEVLSIVDLKGVFGLPHGASTVAPTVVVVAYGELRTGLLVDSVGDLISLAPEDVTEGQVLMDTAQRAHLDGAARWGGIPVRIINLEALRSQILTPSHAQGGIGFP